MAKSVECPPSYETYIDIIKPTGVKSVIWIFFQKCKDKGIIKCKKCWKEFVIDTDRNELVEHLKSEHYGNYRTGFCYSYESYFEHLTHSVKYNSYQFSEFKENNLKLSFGVRYAENFNLLRFPESRKTRTVKSTKISYKSDWQKLICQNYTENPVGSYQGHFDRPIIFNVY